MRRTIKLTVYTFVIKLKLTQASVRQFLFSNVFIMKPFIAVVSILLIATLILSVFSESQDQENEIDDFVQEKWKQYAFNDSGQFDDRGKLISYLLDRGYDKRNYPSNMTVKFGISLLNIDIDEKKSTVEAHLWFKLTWIDKRLAWNQNEFDVGVIRILPEQIWHPDVTLYNSATIPNMMKCYISNVVIYHTGEILWAPPCHLSAFCNLTLATDPYGPQHCVFHFGSWAFDGISMDLQIWKNETTANMEDYEGVTQWEVISNSAARENKYYSCCEEPYPAIIYNFTIQRKPASPNAACSL